MVGKLYPEGVAFKTFDMSDRGFHRPEFHRLLEITK